jgi:sentrin-specific protease 8
MVCKLACMKPIANMRSRSLLFGKSEFELHFTVSVLQFAIIADSVSRYLEHDMLASYKKAKISLIRPSMSFMLLQTEDALTLKEALPDFTGTTHIFLPVNDNNDVEMAEGGSHWSLLLISVIDGVAFHYDSLGNANERQAMALAMKMGRLLGRNIRFINMDDTPKQDNGQDCGVFVCLIMRFLLERRLLRANASEKVTMSMAGKDIDPKGGRKMMIALVDEFRKEGQKRSRS